MPKTLREGDTGWEVGKLQKALNDVADAGLKVDEIFGPLTLRAVKDFQLNHGLPTDGVAGDALHDALLAAVRTKRDQ